jgi:hypothetical protein
MSATVDELARPEEKLPFCLVGSDQVAILSSD